MSDDLDETPWLIKQQKHKIAALTEQVESLKIERDSARTEVDCLTDHHE